MWSVRNNNSPIADVSQGAEKAFNCVEWRYLFQMLEILGFEQTFLKWVKLLYNAPQAAVQINGVTSSYFRLWDSARFTQYYDWRLYTLLYADDTLVFITNPGKSIPVLLRIIKFFSSFSGYQLNWTKSDALPLTSYCPKSLFQAGSFPWPLEGIKYLGILIPSQRSDITKM